jgi:hypothetical protein
MSYDSEPCPGPTCPWCNGSACRRCAKAAGRAMKKRCAHSKRQRHTLPRPKLEEVVENLTPKACASWLELAALSDPNGSGPWAKAELFRMARALAFGAGIAGMTTAHLEAGLALGTLKVRKGLVSL